MKNKMLIVVVEGPSGVGKDSIIKGLIAKRPDFYEKMPSVTNREMREGEAQGMPYYFVSTAEFEKMQGAGDIFEWTMRHGTYRGMSYRYINEIFKRGHVPIKDCDLIGVNALKKAYPNRVLTIFVTAPKEQVRARLSSRGDKEADIEVRLKDYDNYIKEAGHYDNQVQNIVLDEAIREIDEIIVKAYEALL